MWWVTTRAIISIFEDYLDLDRATPTPTFFRSYPHLWSNLVWDVIRCHIAEEKMQSKTIKDHPIVVGTYA